jgi:predicted Zn-dependent protease
VWPALAQQPNASDWQCEQRTQRSTQLFLIGGNVETRRVVTTLNIQLQVYNDHPPQETPTAKVPKARGSTKRTLLEEEINDSARLVQAPKDMLFMASLTDNPSYSLPAPPANGYPTVETSDPALTGADHSRAQVIHQMRERLLAAVAQEPGITLSSAELAATSTEIRLWNSRGIRASRSETSLFCDLVVLASDGGQIAEYHSAPERRRLADLPI